MNRFNVLSFLESYNVDYVTQGSNVKKGNINISCPFCGHDPSKHMGIDPATGFWGCWRNDTHRGRSPVRLIRELIHCSYAEACRIAGINEITPVEEGNIEAIANGALLAKKEKGTIYANATITRGLIWPGYCRPAALSNNNSVTPFLNYITSRGFDDAQAVCFYYSIRYVITNNEWQSMLLLPLFLDGNVLVGWVGRSIKNSGLRYRALEKDIASIPPKEFLFNYDKARGGGKRLFIVEGPFDALKMDWYGKEMNCRAVGLMSMNILDAQIFWLSLVVQSFEEVVVVLDDGEIVNTSILLDKLEPLSKDIKFMKLPKGVKDPGELNKRQVIKMCNQGI